MFAESVSIWASVNSWFTPTTFFVVLNLMIGTIYITSTLASPAHHGGDTDGDGGERARARPEIGRSPSVLQRLRSASFYAARSEEPTTVLFADRHQQSLDYDFPQFQNPSGGDDVTAGSQNLQRLNHADRSEESATVSADRHRHPLDLSERFDSVFPQFQNPRNDDVTVRPPSPTRLEPVGLGDCTPPAESAVDGVNSGEPPAEIEPEVARDLGASFEEARGHVVRSKSDTKPNIGDPAPRLARKMRKSASLKSAFSHFREEDSSAVESRRPATARLAAPPAPEADEGVDAKADDFINRFKQQLKLQRMDSITRYKEMIGRNSIHK